MKAWETLFQLGGLGLNEDLFKIINPKTFHQDDQKLTALVLQLYSMETFLFDMMVKTAQNQDESKIKNLGPLACALRAILYGNTAAKDKVAFRGVLLTKQQFDHFRNVSRMNEKIKLQGFTSASTDKAFVEQELLSKAREQRDKVPALVQMFLSQNIDTFELNNGVFSPFYHNEKEIILQDGMAFRFASELHRQPGKVQQINLL